MGGAFNNTSDIDKSMMYGTQETEHRCLLIESNPSMIPDHAIIQTWARWPKKMLPVDQPGTLTNLVLQYLRAHATTGSPSYNY
jgi:hypothetical protein